MSSIIPIPSPFKLNIGPLKIPKKLSNALHDILTPQTFRIAKIAMPFFCLYDPIASTVFIVSGTARVYTHLSNTYLTAKERKWTESGKNMVRTAMAVVLLCSPIFNP